VKSYAGRDICPELARPCFEAMEFNMELGRASAETAPDEMAEGTQEVPYSLLLLSQLSSITPLFEGVGQGSIDGSGFERPLFR
jgi:hypothetical protein